MKTTNELGTYTAKEYSPMAFALIRKTFGIESEDMIKSICTEDNLTYPKIGSGKSGALFMFSKDSQYIIKVIPKREEKILVQILPLYFAYIQENPQTLIPRFYGMFRFEEKHGRIPCDEKDREEMKRMTEEVMKEKGIQREIKPIQIEEICRFGGVQIHSVNSVIGSFVGQEIIKFVTHQFDCLHTTFLMNTITGKSLHGIY